MMAALAVAAPAMADKTISEDTVLTEDTDWRDQGVVTIAEGATLDLNGYALKVAAVSGAGSIVDSLAEYDRLDYIQATGTQYIDTGYRHDDTTKVDMRISFDVVVAGSWQAFYGARIDNTGTTRFGIFLNNQNPWFGPQLGEGRVDITTYTVTADTIYDIHLAKKDEECTATPEGGDVVSLGTGTATSDSSLSGNDYLLAMNRYYNTDSAWHAGFHTRAKLYSCKIYSGETLERDFVPVKRGDDIGLLDLANGKFYANAGSGTFTAGNVVQTAPGGELRIAVAEGETAEISATALRGGLKLVKTGEGTLVMSKASQGYAGGTEVQGGALRGGAAGACVLGAEGTDVAIGSAGSVDLNGNANTADYGWTVSAGGTIVNGGADIADALAVSGVFSPVATAGGFGVVLQDGAKIDFTKWTDAFPVASPAISFASGANITVVLEPRTTAISELAKSRDSETGEPDGYLLAWSEAPSGVTFTTADAGFRVTPDGSGLCVSRKRGFIITIR